MSKQIETILSSFDAVLGIDEVGWGAAAGPITVAGCIVPTKYFSPVVRDSKKFSSERKREEAYFDIMAEKFAWDIEHVPASLLDSSANAGILKDDATRELVSRLLPEENDKILIVMDGNHLISSLDRTHVAIVGADNKLQAVSAASIIAKVTRDRYMSHLGHTEYPGDPYGWISNKGYCTAAHIAAIKQHGVCDQHRRNVSIIQEIVMANKKPLEKIKYGDRVLAALETQPMFVSDMLSVTSIDSITLKKVLEQLQKSEYIVKDVKGRWMIHA